MRWKAMRTYARSEWASAQFSAAWCMSTASQKVRHVRRAPFAGIQMRSAESACCCCRKVMVRAFQAASACFDCSAYAERGEIRTCDHQQAAAFIATARGAQVRQARVAGWHPSALTPQHEEAAAQVEGGSHQGARAVGGSLGREAEEDGCAPLHEGLTLREMGFERVPVSTLQQRCAVPMGLTACR